MTKIKMEEPVINLLHPNCVKLMNIALGRLLKTDIYTDKRGKALKETDPEKSELQLKNDQFNTMQGKQNAVMYFMHLLIFIVSPCLNSL